MTRRQEISTDDRMNEQLKDEITSLRGSILNQAEKNKLPSQFKAKPHPDQPSMVITDTKTGKSTEVALYAYGTVRAVLSDLFSTD